METQETHTEDQSLSNILESAYDKVEAGDPAPQGEHLEIDDAAAAATTTAPAVEGKATDTPAAEPADATTTATTEKPAGEGEGEPETTAEPESPALEDRAPSSWKAEVAEKWAEVPAEVRAEIQRRETDYHKGIEQYKQYANIGHSVERTIAPYMQNIQASGVDPLTAINHLLGVEHNLRNGTPEVKAQVVSQILRDYGIDLKTVQPPAPVAPEVLELQKQNQQLQRFQQSVIEQQNSTAMSEIEQFKANAANVHFEAVKDDMALLLQSNRATSLQDAYDKAVWMRPDIRKSLVEQQRTEAEQKATTQAREKRAKAAAVGIKGSGLSKGGNLNPNASLRETITAAMDGDV